MTTGAPVVADRLPTPPRERKPALAALAVLLILVGALGAATLVLRAGDRIEVIKITERVPAGQPIPDSAMAPVLVAEDEAVSYVRWGQRGALAEDYRPAVDLVAGTLLVGEMLTTDETLGSDEVIVGVSLRAGQFPSGLKAGDSVAAYWVGDERTAEEGSARETVIAERVKVENIFGESDVAGRNNLAVTLRVSRAEAPDLARAASGGDVSLVIVSSGTS
ncbi:hypothetical protein [Streptomyces calidiresistens]|uniref:hypothetical protein n=1 Tax=Streptomyces calidiresistens TaxID=1485586 RepID=UPI002B216B5E|nr:hypothetical protein [Streptomyces calidiresistens]